jgi:hypothetical protein
MHISAYYTYIHTYLKMNINRIIELVKDFMNTVTNNRFP